MLNTPKSNNYKIVLVAVLHTIFYLYLLFRHNIIAKIEYPIIGHKYSLALFYLLIYCFCYVSLVFVLKNRKSEVGIPRKLLDYVVLPTALMSGVLVTPLYSQDIYWNLHHTKAFMDHGINPYLTTPNTFPSQLNFDFDYLIKAWRDLSMTYGPVNMYLFSIGVVSKNININLLLIKTFITILTVLVLYLSRKTKFLDLSAFYLFMFNPILHIMALIDAHNDFFVMVFLFGSYLLIKGKFFFLSFLLLMLSLLTKFVTIVVFPGFLVYILLTKGMRYTLFLLLFGVAVVLLCYFPFLGLNNTGENMESHASLYTQLSSIFEGLRFQYKLGEVGYGGSGLQAMPLVILLKPLIKMGYIKMIGAVFSVLLSIYYFSQKKILEAYMWPLLILPMFFSWYFPWYQLWTLPLMAKYFRSGTFALLTIFSLFTVVFTPSFVFILLLIFLLFRFFLSFFLTNSIHFVAKVSTDK